MTSPDDAPINDSLETSLDGFNQTSTELKHASALLYPPIFTIGIVLNLIVICTFYSGGKLSKIIVLVSNMALADFCMLCTGSYLQYYGILELGDEVLCRMMNAADVAFLHVSAFTIVVIAFERFIRLNYPHIIVHEDYYLPELVTCIVIWAFSTSSAVPVFLHGGFDGNNCINSMTGTFAKSYFTVVFFTSYVIPGIIVALLYTSIIVKTCSSANSQVIQATSQHRITQMLTAIIALFWLFHMPFWVVLLKLMYLDSSSQHFSHAVVLTYLAAATNPFFYFMLRTYHCQDFIKFFNRIRLPCITSNEDQTYTADTCKGAGTQRSHPHIHLPLAAPAPRLLQPVSPLSLGFLTSGHMEASGPPGDCDSYYAGSLRNEDDFSRNEDDFSRNEDEFSRNEDDFSRNEGGFSRNEDDYSEYPIQESFDDDTLNASCDYDRVRDYCEDICSETGV